MHSRLAPVIALAAAIAVLLSSAAYAQPVQQTVRIIVAPERPSWEYAVGEKPDFVISAFRFGNPLDGVEVSYRLGPEKMDPAISGKVMLKNGVARVGGVAMTAPGFLQCRAAVTVEGREYSSVGAAGFEPLSIKPSEEPPADFADFWEKGKAELARIPVDARTILLPDRCTAGVNVYQVSLQNISNSRLYGILCVPKKPGRYPALLRVPGAGVRPYAGNVSMAEKGMITLEIGIHGIPVILDPGVYTDLGAGALNGYPSFNLDSRDAYYFRRVFLGCIRAVDFLAGLQEFEGERLAVTGSSQGGALSFVTAGLDSRVKWLGVCCPALCDVTGYLHGRAGGWPHLLARKANQTRERIETSRYYDALNFARLVKAPGIYSWGFPDESCPPTSTFAAYNVITAPKELYLVLDSGHWNYPEQNDRINAWLVEKLLGK